MKYAYLGNSGLVVSRLALGTMTFAAPGAPPFAQLARSDALSVVARALDAGINVFDSANVYSGGHAESVLGEVLGTRRREAIIVTKAGSRTGRSANDVGLSARHLLLNVEDSLRRLRTDWIDVYLCHLPDTRTPLEETLLALDQIVRAGKVRYIGFSNWPAWLSAKAIALQKANHWATFVAGQVKYNLLERDVESDIVPSALDAGVGLMCYSPLASGLLSGKYAQGATTPTQARLNLIKPMVAVDRAVEQSLMPVLLDIAAHHRVPTAAVALSWLWRQPAVASVLFGVNRPEQLEENLVAATLDLSAEELARLEAPGRPAARYPVDLLRVLGDGAPDPRDRLADPVPAQRGPWAPKAR